MNNFNVPSEMPGEKGWVDHLAWRVPIDDESHYSCTIELHHISDESRQRYDDEKRRVKEAIARLEIGTRRMLDMILAGEASLDDCADRPDIVTLEDGVAQEGQGRSVNRSAEHLGRSDNTLILRRKIHLRELRALAEGRPLKEWTVPESQLVTTGV